jgi:hypothetical protein
METERLSKLSLRGAEPLSPRLDAIRAHFPGCPGERLRIGDRPHGRDLFLSQGISRAWPIVRRGNGHGFTVTGIITGFAR